MNCRIRLLAAVSLSLAPSASPAQGYPFSQRGAVSQTIAFTTIRVEYGRPVARGRLLFGDSGVVKWNAIWHPGADSATRMSLNHTLLIEDHALTAGEYSLWLIPRSNAPWTLIFNTKAHVSHTPYAGAETEVLRLDVQPEQGQHMESMAIYFPMVMRDSAVMRIHWGDMIIPLHIKSPFRPLGVAGADSITRRQYPAHWWAPISDANAPEWEILPQAAGSGQVILSKRHELGLLSNFAATPLVFRGKRYASLEGFWQMMLYPENSSDPRARFPGIEWKHTRDEVAQMTAFEAKAAGTLAEENMKKMGIGWVTFAGRRMEYRPRQRGAHYELIVAAMREKVRQNPSARNVLLATGDLVLMPDHHPEQNAPDAWGYNRILMQLRHELQLQR